MTTERVGEPGGAPPISIAQAGEPLPTALRLQILTTEHWSLLATRSMTWNEAFSRSSMFLAALSGSVVALALVAQATSFGSGFAMFALVVLPVVLFIGIATVVRLLQANNEDLTWVIGMNRLRHAYLELAPELEPYFVAGWHDDRGGLLRTFAAQKGNWTHGFVTTPGMITIVVSAVAGALVSIASLQIASVASMRLEDSELIGVVAGVIGFLVTLTCLFVYGQRTSIGAGAPVISRFPGPTRLPGSPAQRPD